jgi:protein tyrosine/serine phosphatase
MKKIIRKFEENFFILSFISVIGFLILWLANGFSLGRLTLLGPIESISSEIREHHYSQNLENIVIKIIILIFVIVSFFISAWIMKMVVNSSNLFSKISVFIICFSFAAFSAYKLINPSDVSNGNKIENALGDSQFTLGAYPTEEKLDQLEDENFTAVVSLLHPAIVPFEPVLIEKERKQVTKLGMKFLNIPMLPWISDNEESLNKIKSLMKNKNEKYYIHCYLGKDRVNVVKRIILSENSSLKEELPNLSGTLDTLSHFERGKIYKLNKTVFFTPYPTDEEFFTYILAGNIKQVISLLNPENPEDLLLINKEKEILRKYKIKFKSFKLTDKTSKGSIEDYIRQINSMSKPILIHNFRTGDLLSQHFISLYNNQKNSKN